MTIRSVPCAMFDWNELIEKDNKKYTEKKEEMADFLIDIAEK